MKARYWGLVACFVLLMLVAAQVDWPIIHAIRSSHPSPSAAMEALHACDDSSAYLGPLIPGQATSQPNAPALPTAAATSLPRTHWSTRAGFSISTSADPLYWAGLLGSGWYLDWSMSAEPPPPGLDHWQMVRVHEECISPSPEAIREAASRVPAQVWVIGNEPDVIWQDNATPSAYAAAYHALYALIKAADPSAQVAVGGVAEATNLRLQYLDAVLEAYQERYQEPLPADWWTVHGYVLREEKNSWGVEIPPGMDATHGELYEVSDHGRMDLFISQLVAFRRWMAERGYQDTPLALTEFGILMPNSYGFPPEFIASYLGQTFAWLSGAQDATIGYPNDSYHLVQKWAWFSLSDPTYSSSDLADLSNGSLTITGEQFHESVSTIP